MTATTITGFPVASVQHFAQPARPTFSEVREAHRNRLLAAIAIMTGIGAVSVSAAAAIMLSVTA